MNYLTNYYKNLSEQLQYKVNNLSRLLNEVENPFRVDSPLSTELGADPNTRFIGGVTPADFTSARQATSFNPNASGWQQKMGTFYSTWPTWAQLINDFFLRWNEDGYGFWQDFFEVQEFLFGVDNIEYDENDYNIFTEEHKQAIWELFKDLANFANGFQGFAGPGNAAWYAGQRAICAEHAARHGGFAGGWPHYLDTGRNWAALQGMGPPPSSNPWEWKPGQPLPFRR